MFCDGWAKDYLVTFMPLRGKCGALSEKYLKRLGFLLARYDLSLCMMRDQA